MKKLVLLLLLISTLVLGSFILASCHKYPEDPFISFRRPGKRIEGTWNITSYQVNGVEHSHDFDSILAPRTLTDCSINFKPYNFINDAANGGYTFVDKNNNALFTYTNGKDPFNFIDAGGFSTTLELGYIMAADDSIFYNLFFYRNKNIIRTPLNYNDWFIKELYGKNMHISKNGIDIYFKKQ